MGNTVPDQPDQSEQHPPSITPESRTLRNIAVKGSGLFLLAFAWIGIEAVRHFFFRSQTASLAAPLMRPDEPVVRIPVRGETESSTASNRRQVQATITIGLPSSTDI